MSAKNDGSNIHCKSTPPTKSKVRNPFDKVLIESLHKPICSPGMCKIYKNKNNGSFRWDIDQACTLVPTDIVVCNSQFEPSPDPALEKIAEEATERFFSQEMVMPSPLESSKKVKPVLQTCIDTSIQVTSIIKENTVVMKEVSAQTVLTLPPILPPELERILEPFCTYTKDEDYTEEYEITANGSLRRKLFFEEHSDTEQHYDSEQTDEEIQMEQRPPSSYEAHTPVIFSPDLSRDLVAKGMKRTFGTPLQKGALGSAKPCYRNKILDVVDFGEPCFSPIEFRTPKRKDPESATSSSLASVSISPVTKCASSDEEKNNFTSPESDAMATCLDCVISETESEKKGTCLCKITPNKSLLKRSTSLKNSPHKNKRGSFSLSEKRSLSMSSLNRSRSVQKLDFSMDMSVDGSFHSNIQASAVTEDNPSQLKETTWSIVEDTSIHHLVQIESLRDQSREIQSSTKIHQINLLDDTPIKGKRKINIHSHEISKIRTKVITSDSPTNMSLDSSLDNLENPLGMEDKKIDFNNVDLNFLTDSSTQYNFTTNNSTKYASDSTSFKRVDSGFNENTFYANASSYYESAIKPSELTVTNSSKLNTSKTALKEISNIDWMRVDSGFKDETTGDSMQFYPSSENNERKFVGFHFSEAKLEDKENMQATDDLERFLQTANKNEAMSISDIFTDDLTFNCNFSSTPSKNKSRKVNQ